MWLHEGKNYTTEAHKVQELTLDELHVRSRLLPSSTRHHFFQAEMGAVKAFTSSLDEHKTKMNELNQRTNALLDKYPNDDATALSHTTSQLNTQWSKFNDQ